MTFADRGLQFNGHCTRVLLRGLCQTLPQFRSSGSILLAAELDVR